jgi:hypothetical protein
MRVARKDRKEMTKECEHDYRVVVGPVTIRCCTVCGDSYVLDDAYGWHWVHVEEPVEKEELVGKDREVIIRDYHSGVELEMCTSDELVSLAARGKAFYGEEMAIHLAGGMYDDSGREVTLRGDFHPARHINGDAWELIYHGNMRVTPAHGNVWDRARVVIAKPGEDDAHQARMGRKRQ